MIEEQQTIYSQYLQSLKVAGYILSNPKRSLKKFFHYVNENTIDYLRLTIAQAQDFQTSIMTASNSRGEMRYSKATVTIVITCLCGFYRFLKRKKLIHANPFLEIKRVRRDRKLPRNIPDEKKLNGYLLHLRQFWKGKNLIERKQLYKAHVISEVMYSTGMRLSEINYLKEEHIDFDRGIITINDTKGKKERIGILNEYASRILKIYIDRMRNYVIFGKNNADTTYLFGNKTHLKVWLNMILDREWKRLGYDKFTSHYFRHSLGYHLLRAGCDMRYIQEIIGHEDLNTTQIYTKVDKRDLTGALDQFHPRRFKNEKSL